MINEFAKLGRTTRFALFGVLVIIVAVVMYDRVLEPHVTYLFALRQYNCAMDDILAKNKIIESTLKISKKKLEGLTAQFAQVRGTLFTPAEAEEFFSDLQAVSVETECPIYSLNFISDESSDEIRQAEQVLGVTAKKVVLSVAGLYENVMRLLERLQSRNRKVWIEGINIEAINDEVPQVKCDITIKIYVIQNKEAAR